MVFPTCSRDFHTLISAEKEGDDCFLQSFDIGSGTRDLIIEQYKN